MAEHTPGPLTIKVTPFNADIIDDKGKLIGQAFVVAGNDLLRDLRPAEANARLWALAPEMYDALVHIAEYWNQRDNAGAMRDALYHMIDTALAIIDKVKGQDAAVPS